MQKVLSHHLPRQSYQKPQILCKAQDSMFPVYQNLEDKDPMHGTLIKLITSLQFLRYPSVRGIYNHILQLDPPFVFAVEEKGKT